ncbi:hypothetical protein M422DRAFT_53931 [Sphaerobolus stellatus SS14]|uniref:Uncharacterized protein n=1 Tax=Sphaerobolus stellatus (strain SS14) TaxID=990650 RepID=A0A0C9UXF0_SPHS4|nr:hypothetical protein M422DRAFT_53931 [Sphaerobolus stellatus SS14]
MSTIYFSLKTNVKAPYIVGSSILVIIGYIVLITTHTAGAQYVGTFLTAAGVYTTSAMALSGPGKNVSAQTKQAVVLALQISLGDLGAITGVLVYQPTIIIIALGCTILTGLTATALYIFMSHENKLRGQLKAQNAVSEKGHGEDSWGDGWKGEDEIERRRALGDRHPAWRYRL